MDRVLYSLPFFFQPHHLPLLLFDVLDGLEDSQGRPVVVILVVVIEPQVIKGEAEGFDAPPLEVVEDGFEDDQHIEDLVLFLALAILIHLVKQRTLHTVVFGRVAGPAFLRAIFLTDIVFLENVLDTVRGLRADTVLEDIVGNAGGAVVGEEASCALRGTLVVGEHLVCCFDHHIKFLLVAVDFQDGEVGEVAGRQGVSPIEFLVGGNVFASPSER